MRRGGWQIPPAALPLTVPCRSGAFPVRMPVGRLFLRGNRVPSSLPKRFSGGVRSRLFLVRETDRPACAASPWGSAARRTRLSVVLRVPGPADLPRHAGSWRHHGTGGGVALRLCRRPGRQDAERGPGVLPRRQRLAACRHGPDGSGHSPARGGAQRAGRGTGGGAGVLQSRALSGAPAGDGQVAGLLSGRVRRAHLAEGLAVRTGGGRLHGQPAPDHLVHPGFSR